MAKTNQELDRSVALMLADAGAFGIGAHGSKHVPVEQLLATPPSSAPAALVPPARTPSPLPRPRRTRGGPSACLPAKNSPRAHAREKEQPKKIAAKVCSSGAGAGAEKKSAVKGCRGFGGGGKKCN